MNCCSNRMLIIAGLLLLLSAFASSEERIAYMVKDTHLLSEPKSNSPSLDLIPSGNEVTVLMRKGGWYQARSGKDTGWIKFISVRFQQGNIKGSSGLSETAKLLTQNTEPTLSAGVKGLQEEDLAKALADMDAVKEMESYAVTLKQARDFANEQNL